MFGCLRSCLGKTVALVFLLLVAYAGWRWGPAIFPRVEGWFGVEREEARRTSSPELGEEVLVRYERLLAGQGDDDELVLTDVEVESLILFGLPGLLPAGIDGPSLEITGGSSVSRAGWTRTRSGRAPAALRVRGPRGAAWRWTDGRPSGCHGSGPDVAFLDVKMPGMDGLEVLGKLREIDPARQVVMMISGHGTIDTAVEATRRGAYDFLEKPLDTDRLLVTLRNALE
jgi:CheY-like chemotaxis protein